MQPVMNATTVDAIVADSIADRRLYAMVTAAFAALTLFLAAAGLYGVTTYAIAQRTREIGVRAALGAAPLRLIRLLVGENLWPVTGLLVGLIAAYWLTQWMERFVFGVPRFDLITYTAAAAWVIIVTGIACVSPATRAAHMNPLVALRHE